jgi:drug/metabolite transporter (DMT)-like permease
VRQPEVVAAPDTPTTKLTTQDRLGIILSLLALYLIWGSTYLGMHYTLESFPPFLMSGIRFTAAGCILYAVLRLGKAANPTRAQWIGAGIVGILLVVGGNGLVSFSEQWVASGTVAVMIAASPLWTALAMGLMGRWPTRLEWLGLGIGFAGVILLNLNNGLWATPLGALALLFSPICWAFGSALSGRGKVSLPPGLMTSAVQMIVGGVVALVIALLLGERMHGLPTLHAASALAYLILIGSIVAYSAYGYLLRRVRPALATSYAYVNPIVAVGLGALLAGERVTPITLIAMLIILTGVGLVSLRRHK